MNKPNIIKGGHFSDERGELSFNNDFNALGVKRIYTVKNCDTQFIRGWKGHKIEQRWFVAVQGEFDIFCVKMEDWECLENNTEMMKFHIAEKSLDVLHIPASYATAIQAKTDDAKLLSMSDYGLGEVDDDHNFPIEQFKIRD